MRLICILGLLVSYAAEAGLAVGETGAGGAVVILELL